ncbi:MAG: hypothetical protein ACLR2O_09110 [Coprococcus sp.]
MIHRLNIKICIEGVETEVEWEKIRLLDPDYSQGYLWGKPCSFDELLKKDSGFNKTGVPENQISLTSFLSTLITTIVITNTISTFDAFISIF